MIIYKNEDENQKLVYDEYTDELKWINGDTITNIEPISNPSDRIKTLSYFRKILPQNALSYVERRLKNQLNNGSEWLWKKWKKENIYINLD